MAAIVDAANCHQRRPPSVGMPFDNVCRIHPTHARVSLGIHLQQYLAVFCTPTPPFFWQISGNFITRRFDYKPDFFIFKFIFRVTIELKTLLTLFSDMKSRIIVKEIKNFLF